MKLTVCSSSETKLNAYLLNKYGNNNFTLSFYKIGEVLVPKRMETKGEC